QNRLLLPMLGKQFGEALEDGELQVAYDDGRFFLNCYERQLPLDPSTYPAILARKFDEFRSGRPLAEDLLELESILTAIEHLPPRSVTQPELGRERHRETQIIQGRLRSLTKKSPPVSVFIDNNLWQLNGTMQNPASFDELEAILDRQVYRLSHWKA